MANRSISPYEKYGKAVPFKDANLRVYEYTAADTISLLADRFLGDWTLWRQIADRNNIADVRKIEPGTILIIPEKELEKGIYTSG